MTRIDPEKPWQPVLVHRRDGGSEHITDEHGNDDGNENRLRELQHQDGADHGEDHDRQALVVLRSVGDQLVGGRALLFGWLLFGSGMKDRIVSLSRPCRRRADCSAVLASFAVLVSEFDFDLPARAHRADAACARRVTPDGAESSRRQDRAQPPQRSARPSARWRPARGQQHPSICGAASRAQRGLRRNGRMSPARTSWTGSTASCGTR